MNPVTSPRGFALRLGGLAVIVASAVARFGVSADPFPGWDADPFVLSTPEAALGPAALLLVDAASLLGALIAMMGVALAGSRVCTPAWVVLGGASFSVGLHAFGSGELALDHLRLGSPWVCAFAGGVAAFEVCRDQRLRRLVFAALVGVVALLAAKGALQVFVEHPQTVAMFKQTRETFFESQGWTPDSAAARAFERRLLQPEGSGWFGMANVFASWGAFGACSAAGAAAGALLSRSGRPRPAVLAGTLLGAACGTACVALAGSKGGWGAMAIGVGAVGGAVLARLRPGLVSAAPWAVTALRLAPAGAAVTALGAVVARGLVGERSEEISILFRWFYIVGASRIFVAHPWAGVGPDGFKDAYMVLKPALSPEEVTSPHSIVFDFGSTLGLAGLGMAIVWFAWTVQAGRRLVPDQITPDPEGPVPAWSFRSEARLLFVIVSVPVVLGALVEVNAATPEATFARLAGLAAAVGTAVSVAAILRACSDASLGLACGAAALAAHAQIELTPVWTGSSAAFMLVFGAAAAPMFTPARAPSGHVARWVVAGIAALLTLLVAFGWRPVDRWQRTLDAATVAASPAFEAKALIQRLESSEPSQRASVAGQLSDHLSRTLGRPVGDTQASLSRGVEDVFLACATASLVKLEEAASSVAHPGTLQAASRLSLQVAATHRGRGEVASASEFESRAQTLAERASELPMHRATSYGWLGTVRMTIGGATDDRALRELAMSAWEGAARADPLGLTWPVKLARGLSDLGRAEAAAAWARRALENDGFARLDPLRGLLPAERLEMTRLAGGS